MVVGSSSNNNNGFVISSSTGVAFLGAVVWCAVVSMYGYRRFYGWDSLYDREKAAAAAGGGLEASVPKVSTESVLSTPLEEDGTAAGGVGGGGVFGGGVGDLWSYATYDEDDNDDYSYVPSKPLYAVSEQMRRKACAVESNAYVKSMQRSWMQQAWPLLVSVILAPRGMGDWVASTKDPLADKFKTPRESAIVTVDAEKVELPFYHVFLNIRYMRGPKKAFWTNRTLVEWYCDGELAHIVGRKDRPHGSAGDPHGVTLVIRCPRGVGTSLTRVYAKRRRGSMEVAQPHPGMGPNPPQQPQQQQQQPPGEPREADQLAVIASYNVTLNSRCAQSEYDTEYQTRVPNPRTNPPEPPLPPPKYVACPIVWGPDSYEYLKQWIAYHRILGFDHFFVYLHEAYTEDMAQLLPSAPYITYRPFDVDGLGDLKRGGGTTDKNFYQPIQQTECIYRAREWGPVLPRSIQWVAIMDIDEYFQILVDKPPPPPPPPKGEAATEKYKAAALTVEDTSYDPSDPDARKRAMANKSELAWVLDRLERGVHVKKYAGVMIKNWFWGADPAEIPLAADGSVAGKAPAQPFMMDYVHKAPVHKRTFREKNIVHPWNVAYYNMHRISEGIGSKRTGNKPHMILDPRETMRMNHFKQATNGVFDYMADEDKRANIIVDTSQRDKYKPKILKQMKTMEYFE